MTRSTNHAVIIDLLHSVSEVWSAHCGVTLPTHQLQSITISELKEFCVGLLENKNTHPWNRALSRCDGRKAVAVAGSLFLFRKCLPAEWSETEMCQKHRAAMLPRTLDPLPSGYLQHVRSIVASQFQPGWDRGYESLCWSATPSVGACTGSPRSKGGTRALRLQREVFLRRTLGHEAFEINSTVAYQVVNTGGKGRGVTIADWDMGLLGPCHKKIYNHMSDKPWLLRGEARGNSFKDFTLKEGEIFVSGDYESASDNLRVDVAEAILDVLQSSSRIPASVWNAARAYLHCKVQYPDLKAPLETEGQLMGNLLCFPLLCLQNYCAFRFVFDERTPVRINGDDIVFRSTKEKYEEWSRVVGKVGLVLSRGKTLVEERFFSLNSAFFWPRSNKKPRPIPVTRVASFSRPFEDWGSLRGSFFSLTSGFKGEALHLLSTLFLKKFRKQIKKSGRSVRRGLGVSVSADALRATGLWRRECWYFESVPKEFDCLPISPCRLRWASVPKGWKRVSESSCLVTGSVEFVVPDDGLPFFPSPRPRGVRKGLEEVQKSFWSQVAHETWVNSPTRGALLAEYQAEVLNTGWEGHYLRWRTQVRRPTRLLSAFAKLCRVNSKAADAWHEEDRGPMVWVPIDSESDEVVVCGYTLALEEWQTEQELSSVFLDECVRVCPGFGVTS